MANNVPAMVWSNTPFEPPPPKGPPPKIPLPKTPTQAQMRNAALSPLSQPAADDYFKKINYSLATPPRQPPRTNVRAPILHRVSESESIDEVDDDIEPPSGPRFRGVSNGSPVSPHTIADQEGILPSPSAFELDKSGRKGSGSSQTTIASLQSQPHMPRVRSSITITDDDEPPAFVAKADKHKRVLGIDQKSSQVKRGGTEKSESSKSISGGPRRKRSVPDIHDRITDRSSSPLPAPDVVPFLYQDIEDVRRQPAVEAPLHPHPVSALPAPQLNISSNSNLWNRHSSPNIKPADKMYQTPLNKASTNAAQSSNSREKKEKQRGILGRFRAKKKEEADQPQDHNPYPLANLGVLSGANSFSDLHLPNPSSTSMKHQQSFSSLSSSGATSSQPMPGFSFNTFGQVYTPQAVGATERKPLKHEEPKSQHHHHSLFHRHHSPSQAYATPTKGLVIDDQEIILDTDLGKLQGIVSNKVPQSVLEANGKGSISDVNPIAPWETSSPRTASIVPSLQSSASDATWTAPESWGVRPHTTIAEELPDFPEEETVVVSRQTYCLRVFRTDSTFATISCPANTSVTELLTLLAKKFFVATGERWVLVHYINNLARILQPHERPVALQQKSLERLGYVEDLDGGGEMGRDDWSGYWRFVFMRADALSNIAEEVHLDQYQNVNLDSKNLQTIPLSLYRHAAEILTLNVSRNMSLSIPSDFIDSCTSLQEIRFTHNQARRIPKSIPTAPALTHLDLSHNRLEDLDHIGLTEMYQLISLKVANNRLKAVPSNITQLMELRVLDLSSNYFTEFPTVVTELAHLADLDLSFNMIEQVPESIGQLTELCRFVITNNKLRNDFPTAVSELESLRELDCRFNSLHNIDVVATIPGLESLYCGHNQISAVNPSTRFAKLRHFHMNKNPTTKLFLPIAPEPSRTVLTYLNMAGAKLSALDEIIFDGLQNLERLVLDDNAFTGLPYLGKLRRLQVLHCANNSLQALPKEIGTMAALKFIDVHNNNIKNLPPEIWQIVTLEGLNATSNLLSSFPKPPPAHSSISSSASGLGEELTSSSSKETIPASRKNSSVSVGRMAKIMSQESVSSLRKDSSASTMTSRTVNTIAHSLKILMLGDNRLGDDVFEQISFLVELRCLNLSYNEIYEIPTGALSRLTQLTEMYLSGNELTSLPADDLERLGTLRILHLNCNKLQTLPAELGKIRRLHVLDVGSNSLKYNISNWPYDWNWNWNLDLKYLSLSGNKKLEIKQQTVRAGERDLSDFHALTKLRLLGLMDVTAMGTTVPDQTENRRVRTIGSEAAGMAYGLADTLGKHDYLSIFDTVTPNYRGSAKEVLYQMFDGQPKPNGGNRVAKYLQDNFRSVFLEELKKLKPEETVPTALRRAFLSINKTITDNVTHNLTTHNGVPGGQGSNKRHPGPIPLDIEDLNKYGSSALVAYVNGKNVTIANVGDTVGVLARTTGEVRVLSKKHRPGEATELERIRNIGGSLTRNGKISYGFSSLETSRAIGYIKYAPAVIADPYIEELELTDQDEVLILANNELWRCISYQTAVDVIRTERDDALRAAHKLRDFGIAYGASGRICVMVIRVGDLFHKKARQPWSRNASVAYGSVSGYLPTEEDGFFAIAQKKRKGRDELPEDSTLARLEREVPPPVGMIAMVFTDIKNSTMLWELHPVAMRSAIKTHNVIMRRQMRIIGGYEVKTEGDAFIVAFPEVTTALQWCFAVQTNLLSADWPSEILESEHGSEVYHPERGDLLHRGLSVRMGCHYGNPVCEVDPITRRMDYFGPMMNRTARISAVADGGQITISSDVETELRNLENFADSIGDAADVDDTDLTLLNVKREMEALKRTGFAISPVGERKLKGLENLEFIYLIYPNQLIGRLHMDRMKIEGAPPTQHQLEGAQAPIVPGPERIIISDDVRIIPLSDVRLLHMLAYRIEKLCSTNMVSEDSDVLQQRRAHNIREEDGDEVLIQAVESLVTRIENAVTRLSLRHCAYQASTQDIILDDEDIIKALQAYVRSLQEQKEQSTSRRLRRFSTYQGARYSMPPSKSLGISFI